MLCSMRCYNFYKHARTKYRSSKSSSTILTLLYRLIADRFIVLRSKAPNSDAEQVTFPLSSLHLHTTYFRIYSGNAPTELHRQFGAIVWELVNILKENFPSKVQLTQENIELCAPEYIPMSQSEEIRRQLSCILSIKEESRILTLDEAEDVVCTMDFAEKIKDYRSMSTCLELLNSDKLSD